MRSSRTTADSGFSLRVDSVIDGAIAEQRIVGAVVLAAEDGVVVYRRAAGFIDREAGVVMPSDAIFRLSSLTKPFVAVAALALADSGRLDLDHPVTRWLPDFQPRLADGSVPEITVRHLLCHTAGLSYRFGEPVEGPYATAGVSDGLDQPGLGFAENLRRIQTVPLSYVPGAGWAYSVATDILGGIVAQAHGRPLGEAVEKYVASPLGLRDTGFAVKDAARLAVAYADERPAPIRMREFHVVSFAPDRELRFAPARIFDGNSFQSGGIGMAGTAEDFLALLEALRKGGGPLLKPDTVRVALANQVGNLRTDPKDVGWGFGFLSAVLVDPDSAAVPYGQGTWRWGGVYGHSWFVDPSIGLSVVVLTNTPVEGCFGLFPNDVRDAFYGPR
jgi:CubicO group peptidase (beta-lactamase class C family)